MKEIYSGGSSGVLFGDQRNFYPEPQEVSELWSDMFPFTQTLSNTEIKQVNDPLYKMFENESSFYKREFTVTTALTIASNGSESSALTVSGIVGLSSSVDSSWIGLWGDVFDSTKTTLKGQFMISTAASSTTIKCKTLKATAITTASGDYFVVNGRLRGEKSVAPEADYSQIKTVWNSTAFMSDAAEISATLKHAAMLRGYSDEMSFQRKEMMKRYLASKEDGLIKMVSTIGTNMDGAGTFNEDSLRTLTDTTGTSGSVRTTYGYAPILTDYGITYSGTGTLNEFTNVFDIPGPTTSYNDMISYAEIIFNTRDTDEALAFCGRSAITTIAQRVADGDKKFGWLGKATLSPEKSNLTLGFKMRALETNHGILWLVSTKSLRNAYKDYILIPNLDHVGIAVFRADEYKSNVKQDNDYDGYKDTIKSEQGIWMRQLKSHHMIRFK